jgi:uncharacterized protein (DUF924 family)
MLRAMDEALQVREFWFGKQPQTGEQLNRRMKIWYGADSPELQHHLDESIRERFGHLVERAASGELDSWADGPRRRLSLILLLDQFPRNLYRNSARAFATDDAAMALAMTGMQSGADAALKPMERVFFYSPLQHCEALEVQDESVAAYRRLLLESPEALHEILQNMLGYAQRHREVIKQFGRFPHRNKILGRASTPEEFAYLRDGGETFGS